VSWHNGAVTSPTPRVLLQPETLALADEVGAQESITDLVGLVSSLRKAGHPHDRVHHALEQVRLRRKAVPKLGPFAARMLFTEPGLEQATRLHVAAHHAGRFLNAGMSRVADLGCGLGVDSMAMAALGLHVTAIDQDELTAALATYNLAPFDTARVIHGDALAVRVEDFDGLWLDPARRDTSKRLTDPHQWSPSLTDVFRLGSITPAGIKLAPGIDRTLLPDNAEWQWVSADSDVVEVVVWTGSLARDGVGRAALVIRGDTVHEMTAPGDSEDAPVGDLGQYLWEPDGALIRARLIGDLARQLDGRMLSPTIAYITTDTHPTTPFASGFRVTKVMPYKIHDLKKWVREENIGTLEIKKRGIDVDPAVLRPQLSVRGDQTATLILTRLGDKKVAIAAERLPLLRTTGS
jgi:protein-L-isoaspartate O-methyltransferase